MNYEAQDTSMDQHTNCRVEDVRGELQDEVRFLSHLLFDRVYHKLPPEFWQHTKQARKEMRAALLILLRAAIEHVARELEEEAEHGPPVSAQRGKIQLDPVVTPPPTNGVASAPAPAPPTFVPPDPATTSRQRKKIALE